MNKDSEAVKKYFTKEVSDRVNDMTISEMTALLKELEGTRFWIAIIKYSHERLTTAQNALITLDPFKDQTLMARYQGVMSGVLDLQDGVITLKSEGKKAEDPENAKEAAKDEAGGAYGVI